MLFYYLSDIRFQNKEMKFLREVQNCKAFEKQK